MPRTMPELFDYVKCIIAIDVIGNAIHVMRVLTGETADTVPDGGAFFAFWSDGHGSFTSRPFGDAQKPLPQCHQR
jgi:hypothetical protein